jgi:pilus assembly protein TadC
MNSNLLPEFLRNETMFFMVIAVGIALVFVLAMWLIRELRGGRTARPRGPSDSIVIGGTRAGESGQGDAYRGSAGVTRTMDSSPSGILGSIARAGGSRPSVTHGTSIITGSSLTPTYGQDRDREQIEPELRQAGFYRPSALAEFKSVRAMLVLMPLCVAAAVALMVEPYEMPVVGIGGVVCAALGSSVPRVYIAVSARRRRREIERGLPVALDLIVLGLVAGQNVMNSFKRTALEVRRGYPILSEEMQIAYRQAELNTLGHALRVWADRCGVQEVYNLSVVLTQAERQGADVSTSLLEFSSSFRVTLRQRADAQANRASFYMIFPTLLCMWIPAAVILAAPVYMDFSEKRTKAREAMLPPESNKTDSLDKQFAPYLQGANQDNTVIPQ